NVEIDPAVRARHDIPEDDQHLRWDHQRGENHHEDGAPPGKLQLGQHVPYQRVEERYRGGRDRGDDQAVGEPPREPRAGQHLGEVRQRGMRWDQAQVVDFRERLERAGQHPVKWKCDHHCTGAKGQIHERGLGVAHQYSTGFDSTRICNSVMIRMTSKSHAVAASASPILKRWNPSWYTYSTIVSVLASGPP